MNIHTYNMAQVGTEGKKIKYNKMKINKINETKCKVSRLNKYIKIRIIIIKIYIHIFSFRLFEHAGFISIVCAECI